MLFYKIMYIILLIYINNLIDFYYIIDKNLLSFSIFFFLFKYFNYLDVVNNHIIYVFYLVQQKKYQLSQNMDILKKFST